MMPAKEIVPRFVGQQDPQQRQGKRPTAAQRGGMVQIQCRGKRSPSLTRGGWPRRKFCISSAPVLAVVKMLTTSRHSASHEIDGDAREEYPSGRQGLGEADDPLLSASLEGL